jgi:hypothetical protein
MSLVDNDDVFSRIQIFYITRFKDESSRSWRGSWGLDGVGSG